MTKAIKGGKTFLVIKISIFARAEINLHKTNERLAFGPKD